MAPGTPDPLSLPFPDSALSDLLEVSLTGVNVLRPVYDPAGEITDFLIEYLNPAGQRMTGLAERPGGTLLTRFPESTAAGILAYYRRVYADGATGVHEVNYQADGLDNFFRLAARRSGELLVVSFTDTADQNRSAVELALRESQAAEQAARADAEAARRDAEAQRQRLHDFMSAAPGVVLSLVGPQHVIEFANEGFRQQFGVPDPVGKPYLEALPQAADQHAPEYQATALYDHIYRTGEPYYAAEAPYIVDPTQSGRSELRYFTFAVQAARDGDGRIVGVQAYASDVTDVVRARQQVQQLNQELEARVAARTEEALALQADLLAAARQQADQRDTLYQVFEQTAGVVALLREPGHRYEYVNPAYQAFFPGRPLVGLNVADAVPELAAQGFVDLMDRVYQTGETYFGQELPFTPAPPPGQAPRTGYFNFTYQAYREHGAVAGVSIFAYDVTEQVEARRHQETEREQLYGLFTAAAAPIVIFDGPGFLFQLVNPAYQRIFPGRALLGKPLLEALPELTATPVMTELQAVYDTGEPHIAQAQRVPLARHEGGPLEDLYFTFTYQARRNAGGEVDGVLCIGHEVTEQVLARQRVEESREELKRFQFMADQARDAFILMRADGSFAYLNQKALDAWGYTAAETRHLRVPDVDPLHDQAAYAQLFARLTGDAASAPPGPFETRHRRKDGQVFPVEISLAGLQLGGEPHLLAVARDVTDRQRTLAALQESEARFRTLADAAPNIVWDLTPDGALRYVNKYGLEYLGITLDELVAHNWMPLLPEDVARTEQVLGQAMAGRTLFSMEHRLRRHDGQYRWWLTQGAPSYYPNGELYGYVGSGIDITELKRSNEQLVRTNADLDNFIYTASHDLKAPISNLEGLLHLLQLELPPAVAENPTVGPVLGHMLDAVDRFKRTIDHLTEVSKLQKEHAPATTLVNLAAVVEGVRQDLAPQLRESNAQLTVSVSEGPAVHFSEKNLRSVVYNLLSNALKYRHPDRRPHVDVRAHLRGGFTVLEVHDNGLGLDPDHLPRLFTMFQRFHDHVEGTGIGLFMLKRMVDNAGGRVEVHSQLGAGTTFFIHLPHAAPAA